MSDRRRDTAEHFVRSARLRMQAEAASACDSFSCGSSLGVRQHMTALRRLAERCARIDEHILRRRTRTLHIRRAADDALAALDEGSRPRLRRALSHITSVTR